MSDRNLDDSSEINPQSFDTADDNVTQSFQLETSSLRGRLVRLGSVLDDILTPHKYPDPVAHLVAETATLALLLSSMMKYDGIFTLQTKGDGPVSMLVSDVTSTGEMRACASFDEERLEHSRQQIAALKTTESSQNHLAQYLGKGYIAFTVDQGEHTERYQGIVELKGSSLIECVQHYFQQSEQIGTGMKMAAGQRDGKWRAGGIMLQHMPEDEKNPEAGLGNLNEDDWRRSMILMDSVTEEELLDPALHSNTVLLRLFHEEGVRVYKPIQTSKGCRCSEEKVHNIVAMMPKEDLEYATKNGKIHMHCEFCSRDFIFDPKAIQKKKSQNETQNKN